MKINYLCGSRMVCAIRYLLSNFQSNRLFAVGALLSISVLVSCSSDSEVLNSEQDTAVMPQTFSLVPTPAVPIEIEAISEDGEGTDFDKKAQSDRGRFNITLRYLVDLSPRQLEVFDAAAARWERIIIKDVPSFTGSIPSSFVGVPNITGTIDDIVIEVVVDFIDGPGGILGQAGPRFVRNVDGLPLSGVMFFDEDDLDFLEDVDLFEEVIVHEMGHVLGIGPLWAYGRTLIQGTVDDPYITGFMANVHWNASGGTDALPIENQGGPGTALGHWRESVLGNELMTGYINYGENPLSRITAGSLRDLGYGTAVKGEQYKLPKGTAGVEASSHSLRQEEGLHIAGKEIIMEPIGFIRTKKKK